MPSASFVDAVRALGGHEDAEGVAAALLERWREPHRGYHDEQHLREVLAGLDRVAGSAGLDERGRAVTVMAAWYHDAVYEGRPGEDEELSARLAGRQLTGLGLSAAAVAEVEHLVRATTTHELVGRTGPAAALHDADLWILSAPEARFDEYCEQVRAEYAHVSDEDFAAARRAVLTPFVTRQRLYATDHADRLWSASARVNLTRELDRL